MRFKYVAMLLGSVIVSGAVSAQDHFKFEKRRSGTGKLVAYLEDPAGAGVTGSIWLCTADGCRISQWHSEATRNGRFDITNLKPGKYQLRVDALTNLAGDMVPPAPVTFEASPNKTIRVTLTAVCP